MTSLYLSPSTSVGIWTNYGVVYLQIYLRYTYATNQTPQAGIGLHFIAIVISESPRKKSNNKN